MTFERASERPSDNRRPRSRTVVVIERSDRVASTIASHVPGRPGIPIDGSTEIIGLPRAESSVPPAAEVRLVAQPSAVAVGARAVRRNSVTARGHLIASWLVPMGLLFVWEILARVGVIQSTVLSRPSSVLVTAGNSIATGELQRNLAASLSRAALGFVLGSSTGFALGVLVGFSRLAHALLDRSLQTIRAVPFLAIMPLVIVWFGVGETGKVFVVALASLFPLYLNTVLGIRQVDVKLLEMGRVFGLTRAQIVFYTILPGALASILNGVRLALTTSWLALVGAEALGASAGIGFLATNAREFLQTDVMVLVIVLYALIGITSDLLARWLERHLLAWHPNYATTRP
jgi:sulfonate transport system permease protein